MFRNLEIVGDKLTRWFDELTDRERKLVGLLFSIIFIILILFSFFMASNSIGKGKAELRLAAERLSEIKGLEGDYYAAKARNEMELRKIRNNRVSLFTFVNEVCSRLGLEVKRLDEQKRPIPKSKVVEVLVKLNLSKLSLDRVTALIQELEGADSGAPIKVTRLKINKRYDEPDLLDIQMTISTYKSA